MDNLENPTPGQPNQDPTPTPAQPMADESNDLHAQLEALRGVVNLALVLMLIVSGTLTTYMMRQWRSAKTELEQLSAGITAYQKSTGPAMDEFVRRTVEYSRTHPDFAPLAAKYHFNEAGATPASQGRPAVPPASSKK
jgi:hypothetical protein